ncbi:mitofusin-1 isoform X2 [Thunnus maccoyii]|uniref:mitofusin-1 isoform X2 n=1 Tax=Thunnus maccoyii TaxID=8240 RepID=UPI001C4D2EE7|nr:mitofusin-1 isoform X2 [Thunnus maccoyii]
MDDVDVSPLRRFVVAKLSISSIFDQLLDFVKDGSAFVDEAWRSDELGQVAVEEQSLEMQSCATKLATIREILLRRHMKVAFFGRTSNGKSTVINAMLRDRVLPSGIGHTTNCFLRVEGTDGDEAYLTTEASNERRNVTTVNQLAHALHMDPTLDSGSLVKVLWPKSRCALLRDDLVLMDSPGTDVTLELDGWIDKFCLDADVFVLVGNAESTLMNTEKLFFHKVSERISKPNIFILHNRWDASVTEPEYIEEVRKQHLDRCVHFLAEELRVVSLDEAAGRIFFVSAKEVLISRMQRAQGMPETGETGGALAEGFHERLREFQRFERTFEEFISQSAVKTKFEQHTVRAWQISEAIKAVMDAINIASADRKICCLEEREEQRDRLDFVRGQINRLTDSVKEKIKTLTEGVSAKVATAMSDQIHSLPVLVEEFRADFNPTQETLELYKAKLLQHVEERIIGCLAHRCSISVLRDIRDAQRHMIDFRENIEFQFSLGWTALVTRFIGAANAKRALSSADPRLQEGSSFKDEMVVSIATGLVSVTSRASMTVLIIGGVVSLRCVLLLQVSLKCVLLPQVSLKCVLLPQVSLRCVLLLQVSLRCVLLLQVSLRCVLLLQVSLRCVLLPQVSLKCVLLPQVSLRCVLLLQVSLKCVLLLQVSLRCVLLLQVSLRCVLLLQVSLKCVLLPQVSLRCVLLPQVSLKCVLLPQVSLRCVLLPQVSFRCVLLPQVSLKCVLLPQVSLKCVLLPQVSLKCVLLLQVSFRCVLLPQVSLKCVLLLQVSL